MTVSSRDTAEMPRATSRMLAAITAGLVAASFGSAAAGAQRLPTPPETAALKSALTRWAPTHEAIAAKTIRLSHIRVSSEHDGLGRYWAIAAESSPGAQTDAVMFVESKGAWKVAGGGSASLGCAATKVIRIDFGLTCP